MTAFEQLLRSGRPVVADGAMGTQLMQWGLQLNQLTELWNVQPARAALVQSVHRAYLQAGAQIILTNTIGANPWRLRCAGLEEQTVALNRAGAALARAEAGDSALVAGSIGPSAEEAIPFDTLVAGFAQQAAGLIAGGAQVLWLETIGSPYEARAAVLGARGIAPAVPIVATFSFNNAGVTYTGATIDELVAALADLELVAIGANCGTGPATVEAALASLRIALPHTPLVAKSNAGLPRQIGGQTTYPITPEQLAEHAVRARHLGAAIIGGCCGTTPAHIAAIARTTHSVA